MIAKSEVLVAKMFMKKVRFFYNSFPEILPPSKCAAQVRPEVYFDEAMTQVKQDFRPSKYRNAQMFPCLFHSLHDAQMLAESYAQEFNKW